MGKFSLTLSLEALSCWGLSAGSRHKTPSQITEYTITARGLDRGKCIAAHLTEDFYVVLYIFPIG